jgi:Zn finger protein HypA/HybF involved in hydrogenase expression
MATRSRPARVECECCLEQVSKVNEDGYCAECVAELQLIEAIELEEQHEADKYGPDIEQE